MKIPLFFSKTVKYSGKAIQTGGYFKSCFLLNIQLSKYFLISKDIPGYETGLGSRVQPMSLPALKFFGKQALAEKFEADHLACLGIFLKTNTENNG
ncbi:hypothetical protein COX22_02195 [Candidatus Falkowbacteria bacterium CG23_combo_of_CG06-09_8_20_14_all_49_15]|uniref:Uncharacterized protein n=1 Tax=Candidatus Falkowbacteria bacterium CG23_combo_of_CG06-09_8_20_14_all_49_15 TaxID=1974572 RepID=A0A2G9ZKY1_9BACT|nr:MAG: hypothetical protein COX22_02195 [Candidatus Falkowbacteria bacterium CG23_combo_of_CG06-09_8_20_14_all_49_15]